MNARWMVLLGLGALTANAEEAPALLRFECAKASGAIVVDGSGDDAAWQDVEAIDAFRLWFTLDTPTSATSVKMCYDDDNLYLLYECDDPDVFTLYEERDAFLWESDVVELFVAPDDDSPIYYEFEFAPNGAIFDGRFVNRGSGGFRRWAAWDCDLQMKATVRGTLNDWTDTDEGYTVEVAIPRTAFSETIGDAPFTGQTWRFAAVRMEYSTALAKAEAYVTANCVDGDFHNRDQWYYVTFR